MIVLAKVYNYYLLACICFICLGAEGSQHQRDPVPRDGVPDPRGQPAGAGTNEYPRAHLSLLLSHWCWLEPHRALPRHPPPGVFPAHAPNEVLERKIAHLLTRPTEEPSPKPIVSYHDFTYQAQSWNVSRRVVAKVEWHQGELFPRVGFIVTNLSYPTIGIVRFYNGRGTAEQWIKEGKYALNWTRLSCHKFVANQVRLGLFIMAYNLGNFLRRLVLPESMKTGR